MFMQHLEVAPGTKAGVDVRRGSFSPWTNVFPKDAGGVHVLQHCNISAESEEGCDRLDQARCGKSRRSEM